MVLGMSASIRGGTLGGQRKRTSFPRSLMLFLGYEDCIKIPAISKYDCCVGAVAKHQIHGLYVIWALGYS